MKKILLASTILAGTAGFAAADNANFSFSGSAYTGVAFTMGIDEGVGEDWDGNGTPGELDVVVFQPEVTADFDVVMMTTTDGGLEAGAKFNIEGFGVSVENDHTEDNFGYIEYPGGLGKVEVFLSGEWGKVNMEYEGVGTGPVFAGSGGNVDFEYTNSFGDFDISIWYEYIFGPDNDQFGAEGTYNFADYSVWAGIEYNQAWGVDGDSEIWFGGSASMNGFSLEAEAAYRLDSEEWAFYAEAGYTVDAFSFGVIIEDDNNGPLSPRYDDDGIDYGITASYDLGGGVSIDASYVYDQDGDSDRDLLPEGLGVGKIGVSMSF